MAIVLTSGLDATVTKEYRAYIQSYGASGLSDALATLMGQNATFANLKALTNLPSETPAGLMTEVGELRNDSVEVMTEDGTVVEGNISGEIVLDKNGTLNMELINCTLANINALAAADRTKVSILLVEKDSHLVSGTAKKTVIAIEGLTLKYNESIKGKDVIRGTLSVKKSVPSITNFRRINEVLAS